MTKYLSTVACIFLMLFFSNSTYSQSAVDRYNTAKTQYENGNYAASIQTLKSLEQSIGPNPKIQSLLVYAYVANNDFINAKIELNKYKRMVPHSSSQAHKDLLALESNIDQQLQQLEKNHTANIAATRMKNADAAIERTYNTPERQRVIAAQKENKKIVDDLEKKQKKHLSDLEKKDVNLQKRLKYLEYVNQKMANQNHNKQQEDAFFKQQELKSVKIGQQVWLSENLEFSHFKNGDPIFQATTLDEWCNAILYEIPAWRYSPLDPNNLQKLGKQYNVWAVIDERGLAPDGWRIPTLEDWDLFINFTDRNKLLNEVQMKNEWGVFSNKSNNKFIKIKTKNSTGFSAKPYQTEYRYRGKTYVNRNEAIWWSSHIELEEQFEGSWINLWVKVFTIKYSNRNDIISVNLNSEGSIQNSVSFDFQS